MIKYTVWINARWIALIRRVVCANVQKLASRGGVETSGIE
jgi:hypothetical protein